MSALQKQTCPTDIVLLAQTLEARRWAVASGLAWMAGKTRLPGDRYTYAATYAPQPDFWAFCDDDTVLAPDYLERTLPLAGKGAAGWYAWTFNRQADTRTQGYWQRRCCPAGADADFIGSCGLVASSQLVTAAGPCPDEAAAVEDLWFCGRTHSLGASLKASSGTVAFLPDHNDARALCRSSACRDKTASACRWLFPYLPRKTI